MMSFSYVGDVRNTDVVRKEDSRSNEALAEEQANGTPYSPQKERRPLRLNLALTRLSK